MYKIDDSRGNENVIPAKAGIQATCNASRKKWIPVFTGMTSCSLAADVNICCPHAYSYCM